MPAYPVAPWIHSAETAQMYARGFPLGAQVAEQAARIQEAQARMQLEAQLAAQKAQMVQLKIQLQQQQAERNSQIEQQKLEVLKSYQEQQGRLKQEQLDQAQEKLQQAAQVTARKYQAMASYKQAIQNGEDPLKAILLYGPEMGQQASAEAAAIRASNQKPPYVPGPVQGQEVIDQAGNPVPGMLAFPNASGTGAQVRDLPKGSKEETIGSLQSIYEKAQASGVKGPQLEAIKGKVDEVMQKKFPVGPQPPKQPGLLESIFNKITGRNAAKEPASDKLPGTDPVADQQLGIIKEGAVMGGYKFLGGDPADEKNWDSVIREEDALLPGEE